MSGDLMERPSLSDEYVRRRAAEIIFPAVWGWLGKEFSGCKELDVMRDLMKIAAPHRSGYELSKSLEGLGWMPDDSLVDILADTWVEDAINELSSQWVRCLNIQPQFKIGDSVTTSRIRHRGDMATVVKVDTELAQYGLRYPNMPENAWTTVNFEDCSAVPACVPAIAAQGAQ